MPRRRGRRAEAEAELAAEPPDEAPDEAPAEAEDEVAEPELGDDGALHHFWRFIELRQAQGRPAFNLEDVREMVLAMDEFDAEAATRSDAP